MARGDLQLSVLSLLGPHLNPENAAELFECSCRKSCEEVEELLAARFPRLDVRDAIRRLPARAEVRTPDGGCALDAAPSANTGGPSNRPQLSTNAGQAGSIPSAIPAQPAIPTRAAIPAQRTLEPLSADRFAVRFTADTEFRELLEEVRALAGHREPGATS